MRARGFRQRGRREVVQEGLEGREAEIRWGVFSPVLFCSTTDRGPVEGLN